MRPSAIADGPSRATTLLHLPVSSITESPTNPRQTYGNMDELVESVRSKGIMQPVLVRPAAVGYELVFGHRRLRAAIAAGLPEIPAMVRDLGDVEVLEAQVVENCQREDVPPLEEAEGYRRLHVDYGYEVDEIAAKVGKSKASIYARLKLCELGKAGREALQQGRINASIGLLMARLPTAQQEEGLEALDREAGYHGGEPVSYRTAAGIFERLFFLQLDGAPWDLADAELMPKAGACTTCPKRSGNQPDLFGHLETRGDVCTDSGCFDRKKAAYGMRAVKEAKKKGLRVLNDQETKNVFVDSYTDAPGYRSGFVGLDEQCFDDPERRTYRDLLGDKAPPPVVARSKGGNVVELLEVKAATAALKEAGVGVRQQRRAARAAPSRPGGTKASSALLVQDRVTDLVRSAIAGTIEKRQASDKDWRLLAEALVELGIMNGAMQFGEQALQRRGLPAGATSKEMAKLFGHQVRGLVFELALDLFWDHLGRGGAAKSKNQHVARVIDHFRIDLRKLEKQAKLEVQAAGGVCRVCGCTQEKACKGGCGWASPGVCTKCVDKAAKVDAKKKPAPTRKKAPARGR
jgi:ParB/RepB/Spo0J family partition protein